MDNQLKASSERVYALDALRAVMMLLGLVIHASITYGTRDYGTTWTLKDPDNSLVFDIIVGFIHSFRMPVFFVTAGYFAALLFYKKGAKAMLVNRVKRILLPFLAGVLLIYPLTVFAFTYAKSAFVGTASPLSIATDVIVSGKFLPFKFVHLWFLYFLMMYVVSGSLLAIIFKKNTAFTTSANKLFTYILQNFWLRLFSTALLFFLCLYWMGTPFIKTNLAWTIEPVTFFTYFLFFEIGWLLYPTNSLKNLNRYPILQLSIGVLLFLLSTFAKWPSEAWVFHAKAAIAAIYSTLLIFGFIAFFLTYFNLFSPRWSYIMDAAYWVYIIHLPVVAFIPGLMAGQAIPLFLKFAITLSVTGLISFITYRYFVRSSFIGRFLNGKVYQQEKIATTKELVLQP
ncbi:acyltransferase family protein [Pseudocnuella soli]|uniref:acyltransferase family protein n=1 Tax=Pseudocnuella soli TaxID=2502779 RepID=UPI0010525A2F|nr:acyltransferase family protein [Pseudocnuella soli]